MSSYLASLLEVLARSSNQPHVKCVCDRFKRKAARPVRVFRHSPDPNWDPTSKSHSSGFLLWGPTAARCRDILATVIIEMLLQFICLLLFSTASAWGLVAGSTETWHSVSWWHTVAVCESGALWSYLKTVSWIGYPHSSHTITMVYSYLEFQVFGYFYITLIELYIIIIFPYLLNISIFPDTSCFYFTTFTFHLFNFRSAGSSSLLPCRLTSSCLWCGLHCSNQFIL